MRVKPKDIQVNLPAVLLFDDQDSVANQAAAVNTFIHGKVKIKYEELGTLGGQYVGIFYIQRNNEFAELRESFMTLIENEEIEAANTAKEYDKNVSTQNTYLVNDNGEYCREVPECGCGRCRDPYNGWKP